MAFFQKNAPAMTLFPARSSEKTRRRTKFESAPAGTMIVLPFPLPALCLSFAKPISFVPILLTADDEGFDTMVLVAAVTTEKGRGKIVVVVVIGNRRFNPTELAPLPVPLLVFRPAAE